MPLLLDLPNELLLIVLSQVGNADLGNSTATCKALHWLANGILEEHKQRMSQYATVTFGNPRIPQGKATWLYCNLMLRDLLDNDLLCYPTTLSIDDQGHSNSVLDDIDRATFNDLDSDDEGDYAEDYEDEFDGHNDEDNFTGHSDEDDFTGHSDEDDVIDHRDEDDITDYGAEDDCWRTRKPRSSEVAGMVEFLNKNFDPLCKASHCLYQASEAVEYFMMRADLEMGEIGATLGYLLTLLSNLRHLRISHYSWNLHGIPTLRLLCGKINNASHHATKEERHKLPLAKLRTMTLSTCVRTGMAGNTWNLASFAPFLYLPSMRVLNSGPFMTR